MCVGLAKGCLNVLHVLSVYDLVGVLQKDNVTICFLGHAKDDSASAALLEGSAVAITIGHAC